MLRRVVGVDPHSLQSERLRFYDYFNRFVEFVTKSFFCSKWKGFRFSILYMAWKNHSKSVQTFNKFNGPDLAHLELFFFLGTLVRDPNG